MAKKSLLLKNRALIRDETGTVFKDAGGRLAVCLAYPNSYRVGMSNLGYTGLYTLLNAMEDVVCERAFLPEERDIEELRRTGSPLVSMESGRPLGRFNVLAFSVSFENDYVNVVRMLGLAGLKPRARMRDGRDPLVIMGGACSFMNPEPLAEIVDVIVAAEAEAMADELVSALRKGGSREELLVSLGRIEGVYIPSFYEPRYRASGLLEGMVRIREDMPEKVCRRYVENIDDLVLTSRLSSPHTEFRGMYLLEAMRGCPFSCRFCAAGHVYNPPRRRSFEVLLKQIGVAREKGLRVGLIAPSLTEHKDILKILEVDGVHFSITSLRAGDRAAEMIPRLRGVKSVSIAPEAGSQRLRDVIGKKISEKDILSTASLILGSAARTLRLYFMVGLPSEVDDDANEIALLVGKIRSLCRRGTIAVTLSNFIPKPFTPFQWHPMAPLKIVKERVRRIKKALGAVRGVTVSHDPLRLSYVQGFLSLADRRATAVLEGMALHGDWAKACGEGGLDPGFFTLRPKEKDEVFPWEIIDSGIPREALWREYCRAMSGAASPGGGPQPFGAP